MVVEFDAEAAAEYDEAIEWYRKRSPRTALRFVAALQAALEKIKIDPNRFARVQKGCQRCGLQPFPYSIVFKPLAAKVVIVAVVHAKRRPDYWQHRLASE